MHDLYSTVTFAGTVLVFLIAVIIYFIKKKRTHKDFYLVIIACSFFGLLSLYLLTTSVKDIISWKTGNLHTAEGLCEITYFEGSSGRFSSIPDHYNVYIDGLNLSGDVDKFSYLEEETIFCGATYLKATETLVDIQIP